MFDRNKMAHLVFWPNEKQAAINLIDAEGVIVGDYHIKEPVRGSDLARLVPDGYYLEPSGCTVVTMSGSLMVGGKAVFDTVVVTERAQLSSEERLSRLERKERRREKREAKLLEQKEALEKRLAEREAVLEPQEAVKEPEATQATTKEPEVTAEPLEKGGEA